MQCYCTPLFDKIDDKIREQSGEEMVSGLRLTGQELPCFETDSLLRWLSCHFGSLHVSSLCAWRFPGAAPAGGPGGACSRSARDAPAPPSPLPPIATALNFHYDRKETSLIHWWVQWLSLLLSSPSLSLRISLWPFPSFHQQENKLKKIGRPLVLHMLNFIQIVRHLRTDKTLSQTPRHSLCCQRR